MARSQLLKDAVSGKESIENILLRLKVILSDLDNENIMNWVNGELQGYKDKESVPSYRILKGRIIGTYLINFSVKYKDAPVPLEFLISKEEIDELRTVRMTDGIATIQNILRGENRENYGFVIPTAYCHAISTDDFQIAGMRVRIGSNQLDGIVSCVKSKLVEVIMELEKEFENLDELDIRSQIKENESVKQVIYNIENIIYDKSVKVGDKNKIERSRIGHLFGHLWEGRDKK
ncbi:MULTISPECIES: AbiTii domain-containing protein [Ureibacillus]|uniref:AbiTii domain-containing protein n=2 Tax=Ureibacillus TaxID=160795 RepID=A0A4P6USM1_9BACL|nr:MULTISPECIES: hypothetical protein [Ureibacillus]MBB5149013.1 hypothetical protein [Ureibacillus thermosphaericus]NKZ31726.1 hypothetical protein [Ureibacillus thermosphaericus]QBK24996.1 hypothetical protein DKZ56_03415 [Ureibacillus thermophilus]